MSNQHTLAQAQIVNSLLNDNGVPADIHVDTETGEIVATVNARHVSLDPTDPESPVDPQKIGGGTIKRE